ncbi:ATP-binding protein [Xanthomonas campestris pv. campestris]|uniref:ATP-binding protein n=1 Tax=Xanthomonas campestris TaxID=339 RepID=UPI002AD2988C|nr:ATP-binding protein [Xanthomonas campestris]MEA0736427.1 ATP-binding protein [Xanthomonas campestris pv. campestris]
MTHDWYRNVVELSSDSIKELALDGTIKFVNSHGIARVAAHNAREVLDTNWREHWPEHVRPQIDQVLEAAKRGESCRFEADCVTPSGKRYLWAVTTTPLFDETGKVRSVLAVNRDITDRRLAEMALETLKDALGDHLSTTGTDALAFRDHLGRTSHAGVIKLSQALTSARIREEELDIARVAQRMAESSAEQAQKGEAVGQLLAGVVHDLNNVLQAALGAIDVVQHREQVPAKDKLLLSVAQEALGHGTKMSKRLLGFARHHPYAPERTDLCVLTESLMPLLHQAAGSHANLACELHHTQCFALVDPHSIERALMNLVINARDASPEAGLVAIRVGTASYEEGDAEMHRRAGDYVTLSVIDHGEGIAPEVRDRLFEAYFTTKPSGKGTGLGLAQVYGAVRQANGFIEVISELGHGSTFTMAFPAL